MTLVGDLDVDALCAALPGHAVRAYPAALSAETHALAWARDGAPHGAVVVAEYQASPRGRAGLEWETPVGRGLVFSIVLRSGSPTLGVGRAYVAATCAVADVLGPDTRIDWPETLSNAAGTRLGAVGVQQHENDAPGGDWLVVSMLLNGATPPRAPTVAQLVNALLARLDQRAIELARDYRERSGTIGTKVRAALVPMGPGGKHVEGVATAVRPDGSLVLAAGDERRIVVPVESLGLLHPA